MTAVATPTKTRSKSPARLKGGVVLREQVVRHRPITYAEWSSSEPDLSDLPDLETLMALDLPGSDGEPLENERERLQINLGLESLNYHWRDRQDFYTGGNMFIYYTLKQALTVIDEIEKPKRPRTAFRGPDMFVVLNVDGSYRRQKWIVWEEEGRYPNVIFEFLSPTTRKTDLTTKKELYSQTFRTNEYFCFDYLEPESENSLLGWRIISDQYEPITPNEQGWLWSKSLQLWVGKWEGTYARDQTTWLRFYTKEGELVDYPAKAAEKRADTAEKRADTAEKRAEAEAKARQEAEEQADAAQTELARIKALLAKQGIDLD